MTRLEIPLGRLLRLYDNPSYRSVPLDRCPAILSSSADDRCELAAGHKGLHATFVVVR